MSSTNDESTKDDEKLKAVTKPKPKRRRLTPEESELTRLLNKALNE